MFTIRCIDCDRLSPIVNRLRLCEKCLNRYDTRRINDDMELETLTPEQFNNDEDTRIGYLKELNKPIIRNRSL